MGNNGTVDYVISPTTQELPFKMSQTSGKMYTTEQFTLDKQQNLQWRFFIEAQDQGTPVVKENSTEIIVSANVFFFRCFFVES